MHEGVGEYRDEYDERVNNVKEGGRKGNGIHIHTFYLFIPAGDKIYIHIHTQTPDTKYIQIYSNPHWLEETKDTRKQRVK